MESVEEATPLITTEGENDDLQPGTDSVAEMTQFIISNGDGSRSETDSDEETDQLTMSTFSLNRDHKLKALRDVIPSEIWMKREKILLTWQPTITFC